MPSGCFSKMTFEDLKAFGARSTFIDDLAVFRFRAFITEKSRTQKGQVSFDNAYNIFDDEAKGYVDFKTCLKALKTADKTITKYDVEVVMRKVCDQTKAVQQNQGLQFTKEALIRFAKDSVFDGVRWNQGYDQ